LLSLNITRPIASYLKDRLNLSQDEEAIALFGLQFLIYSFTGYISIFVIALLLGCFWTTLVATLTSAFLRLFSGGAHSKTPLRCTILGAVIAPLLGKTALITSPFLTSSGLLLTVMLGFIISLIIVWRLAPVDSPAKPITSSEYRKKMRYLSLASVCLITAAQYLLIINKGSHAAIVLSASLGVWWQAFTLTKAGHWFATLLDNILEKEGEQSEASLQ